MSRRMRRSVSLRMLAIANAISAALVATTAYGADAKPPEDPSKPVTTVRVGGSPADAEFRDANDKALARYREAKTACRSRPSAERNACIREARADLKTAQRVAKAAQQSAKQR
jgi:hypothetical protein